MQQYIPKFRVWDVKAKRMYYDVQEAYDCFDCNNMDQMKYGELYTYESSLNFTSFGGILADVREGNAILMQYIGITDNTHWGELKDWEQGKRVKIGYYENDWTGREIYQGDLLDVNNENYDPENKLLYKGIVEVTFEICGFGFTAINPKLYDDYRNGIIWDSSSFWHVGEEDTTKIIGNIFQNPELRGADE